MTIVGGQVGELWKHNVFLMVVSWLVNSEFTSDSQINIAKQRRTFRAESFVFSVAGCDV